MLTDKDHKSIYQIVEEYGGDNKVELRRKLITLVENHHTHLKRKAINFFNELI